ncbi:MAG: [FeFe] hydrogenase H-cluster radical SAM maturase HydG [Syntrophales bacterium]
MYDAVIDENRIKELLQANRQPPPSEALSLLEKGRTLAGLSPEEAAVLIKVTDKGVLDEIFNTAYSIKQTIYGDRLVFFAPLYVSNYCINDCGYCGFHIANSAPRKKLTMDEIREQTGRIIGMGHKRVLLETGEDERNNPIDYILNAIDAVYSVKKDGGEIRRINVNIAATTVENYRRLKERKIGTYQLFQETYHRPTYEGLHKGPKRDYLRQLHALENAFEAGIDDVGLGVLFGLYDWRFEVLSLITHAQYLQQRFGAGPHTISIPRFRLADTVDWRPNHPVSDDDFLKLIAILRIAVPYTGMIITTRERPEIRKRAFHIGISQTSAASSTSPGGFGKDGKTGVEQFEISDRRSLDETAVSIMKDGFTPSFCTACYRTGRTGRSFMDLTMPGDIHQFCRPNSILTLMEYIEDYASEEGRTLGMETITRSLGSMENPAVRKQTEERLERIKKGERDLFF